jgi:hypothetical protein
MIASYEMIAFVLQATSLQQPMLNGLVVLKSAKVHDCPS